MEVLIFQKEAFEEMAAKFNSFSNRVNELLAKQGNQEVCQQLNISPRARFIFHSIGNSFLGILKSLLHQEVLSGHLTLVCHVPVFSLGGSCWFNPSFSPISTLYIDWSSLAFLVKALSLSHRFSYISFLPLVFQYSIYKSLHFIYKSLNHHLSILRRD